MLWRVVRCSQLVVARTGWRSSPVFHKVNSMPLRRSYIMDIASNNEDKSMHDKNLGIKHNESGCEKPVESKQSNGRKSNGGKFNGVKFYRNWLIGLSSVVAAVTGAILIQWKTNFYINSTFKRNILGSTLKFDMPDIYVERTLINNKITRAVKDDHSFKSTVIVIGSRGVGKSTVVEAALNDRLGVVLAPSIGPRNASSVANSVIENCLGAKVEVKDSLNFLYDRLVYLKKKGAKIPLIVVEVDSRWKSEDLEYLLLVAKRFGPNKKLAWFVVIVSAAIGSFNIGITYPDLGCKFVSVHEATTTEAKSFFEQLFSKKLTLTAEEKAGLVEFAVKRGFLNFRRMQTLDDELAELDSVASTKEYLEKEAIKMLDECNVASKDLLDTFLVKKESKMFHILQRISEGEEYRISNLLKDCEISRDDFYNKLYAITPHPLIVDLSERNCYISSQVSQWH